MVSHTSGVPSKKIKTASEGVDHSVAEASNHFGVNLYHLLSKENTNVFFSPINISTGFAMLFCGAENETAEEMRKVLGYEAANINDEELKSCFLKIHDEFESDKEFILKYVNCLLSHKEFPVKSEYKSLLKHYFKAFLKEADFVNEEDEIVKLINEWVNKKTENMIPKILDSLPPLTLLIILSVVYFNGNWVHPFVERYTFSGDFYNNGDMNNCKKVDMMQTTKRLYFAVKESYKALMLPYIGCISMLILLPNSKDGLSELETSLNSSFIQDITLSMEYTNVKVHFPKFKMEYSMSLKEKCRSLGLNRVFEKGAHLNGINDSDELFLSEMIHKAVLKVNEYGTKCRVGTILLEGGGGGGGPEFKVHHPFMFVIFNEKNNLILFMGRVVEL